MKQTAVEWLEEQLTSIGVLEIPQGSNAVTSIFEQAKEMEKQQIINAYDAGYYENGMGRYEPEEYYNETFNK
jgi:hypothetical protein